jgi:predicted nucleic acid-binding protein
LTDIVLDASVAVKWALPLAKEPFTTESLELLRRYERGEIDFLVPDVFWAEVSNVMWKGVRQRRWPRVMAESAASDFRNRDFQTFSSRSLLPDAMKIAFAHDRSIYDSLYVALAMQRHAQMITADERLANALAAHLPVKWLGAW